ncbi:LysR family transcriptional regulator [Streptomyces sp. NBC_00201]|uniref:LysR family transcriptional regulator n=1 Tax=unclassified Streptomyces TaxID=2593676 RepID=UPI002259CA6F|nr:MULTISPECIES: LysR family transcriptional regulator [unclassified Streptomyces]MCX4879288.1 LysR family transcriptional regulator [Streptomyces sp. NBC_00847]MCX5250662.1 LysR family transcriptional regulator [Streptomyces sp. NBC_00201]
MNTLLPFEATVRHASMTAAAQELHVTHGAVSRQVQNLERALGTSLFERQTRTLRPTPQARQLAAIVRDALDQIDAVARQISHRTPAGPLTLSCEPTLLMRWLIPRLPDLAVDVPDVAVHLSAGGGPVFFERDNIDLAIRRDDFPFPEEASWTHLFAERIGPVCRPDLATRLTGAAGVWQVALLHTATRPQAWDDWRRITGMKAEPASQQTLEHFYLTLQAAAAGVGVAIAPYAVVRDDLERGQLVAPFGFVPDGTSYHLLSRQSPEQDGRVRQLTAWLRARTSQLDNDSEPG